MARKASIPAIRLLRPKRSAHASIRGYLYQTCLGVLRWVQLGENELIVFEGDEDLDRLLLGDGEAPGVSEQVKAYEGALRLSDPVVRESLRNFLVAFHELRQRGEQRRFIFTSTASARDEEELRRWSDPAAEGELVQRVQRVQSWVRKETSEKDRPAVEAALAALDGDSGDWRRFLDAVRWEFGAPQLDGLRRQIVEALTQEAKAAQVPPDAACDRLIFEAFTASSQAQPEKRARSRADLARVLAGLGEQFEHWSSKTTGTVFRRVFDEDAKLAHLLDPGTRTLPPPKDDRGLPPGMLLTAAYEVIAFEGREEELALVEAWCGEDVQGGVRLLVGRGGSGKTRLSLEAAQRMREKGWHAGFLPGRVGPAELRPLQRGLLPRLVIVDYAETRRAVVRALLKSIANQAVGPKIRVVLLARRAGEWWDGLGAEEEDLRRLLYESPPAQEVPPLVLDEAARSTALRRAVRCFAAALGRPAPDSIELPSLSGWDLNRVLYLHMAALAVLEPGPLPADFDPLAYTLDHERRFWRKEIEDKGFAAAEKDAMEAAFERTVAALTLAGGSTDVAEAKALIERVAELDEASLRKSLLGLLRRFYGSGVGRVLEPLQPDLLGEELVRQVLEQDEMLLGQILDESSEAARRNALTVLTRLAYRRSDTKWLLESALRGRLELLGMVALEVAIETGDPIGEALAERVKEEAGLELAARITGRCDHDPVLHTSLHVREVAAEAALKVFAACKLKWPKPDDSQQAELACQASNLGNRLSNVGRRQEALAPAEEAVVLYRRLAVVHPEVYEPGLAMSLNNLSCRQRELALWQEALASLREAVAIRRRLSFLHPGAHEGDLAMSLSNLGAMQSTLGYRKVALESAGDAVNVYRSLVSWEPDRFESELATGLSNLSVIQRDVELREEALASVEEAVAIRRRLSSQRPDVFESELAASLSNLSTMQSELGLREEALTSAEQAVATHRRLALQRPKVYEHELASSLNNLGQSQSEVGLRDQALASAEEAVDLYRRLSLHRPGVHEPELARSCGSLGRALLAADRATEAADTLGEGLRAVPRPLAARPRAFASLAEEILLDYLQACQIMGIEPVPELTGPVVEILQQLQEVKPGEGAAEPGDADQKQR